MLDVLEHIPAEELTATAQLVWSLLGSNGYWLLKVPSSDGAFFRVAHLVRKISLPMVQGVLKRLWLVEYESPHRGYFNERNLRIFVERNGFVVVSARYTATSDFQGLLDRLTLDDTISKWRAWFMLVPAAILLCVEKILGRTDSLVILCKSRERDKP